MWFPRRMANILGDDQKQQILALGRLGWPLRRIEQATGVRRETASAYLKAAGVAIRAPRRRRPPPNPASQVSTDPARLSPDLADLPPWPPPTRRAPTASACEPYREPAPPRTRADVWASELADSVTRGRLAHA